MHLIQNLKASSITYDVDVLPLGLVALLTKPFNAFMYLSMDTSILCGLVHKDQAPLQGGSLDVSSHQSTLEGKISPTLTWFLQLLLLMSPWCWGQSLSSKYC